MAETRAKVNLPSGQADGYNVPIMEATERWCEIKLEDGAVLRVKPNVLSVVRVDNQYDADGNPIYAMTSANVMTISSVPAHLKKGGEGDTGGKAN